MLINYSTTDLDQFLSKAETKLIELGAVLIEEVGYGDVSVCILNKIELLTYIIDEINQSTEQSQIDVLVYFALDYFNLHEIAYSPFSILPTTVISVGSGGGSGIVTWDDILGKPSTFPPSLHTHPDEDILIDLPVINQFQDRFSTSFTGTLQLFLEKLMNVYALPAFTSFTQNKGNSFDLGETISGDMTLSWTISNATNVKNSVDSGSITISETSPFTSNPVFNLFGSSAVARTLTSPYTKLIPGSLTFTMNGISSTDVAMNHPTTSLTWYSRIYRGNDTDPTVTSGEVEAFTSSKTNSRFISFTISGSGYKYVFIPDNIVQTGIKFMDTVSGFEVSMEAPVNLTINNPQAVALAGKLYRTKFSLGSALTINII